MLVPKIVNSVECVNNVKIDANTQVACYKIDCDNGIERFVYSDCYKYYIPDKTREIVEENSEFVNGFKVVKLANNYYSYIRESDNKLMPYEYDVAFNFNEYGLAIVGRDGSVSWINKDFKYLDSKGNMIQERKDNWNTFEGWRVIHNFSNTLNPLSKLLQGDEDYGRVIYLDKDGKIKKFYQYDGSMSKKEFKSEFFNGEDFNKSGYAIADEYILYDKGYCILRSDIIKLCLEEGFIDFLFDDADFKYNKLEDKRLQKKL